MDFGKIILTLMCALFLVFVSMSSYLFQMPLYKKILLDQLCRDYMYRVNASMGMSEELRSDMVKTLEAEGLQELVILCPEENKLMRREVADFTVRGRLRLKMPTGLFIIASEEVQYEFKARVYGKRIIN